jgi:hypothetical protein
LRNATGASRAFDRLRRVVSRCFTRLHIHLVEADMCRIATALFLAMALTSVAEAQEVTASVSLYGPFGINDLDGQLPPSAELRFTLPLSDRFALEPFVTAGRHRHRRSAGFEGFFGVQIRHRIGALSRDDIYAFATYGVAAYYSKYGSSPLPIGHFGLGLHQRLSDHLALRPEIQLVTFHVVPIGARYVAGISVHMGR